MLKIIDEEFFPGFWCSADQASLQGQRRSLLLVRLRLGGLLLAAVGGVLNWTTPSINLAALLMVVGFALALVAEVLSWVVQPERDWYSGRALAESAKTLVWRYAVCADPFPPLMVQKEATSLLAHRFKEVLEKGGDRITITGNSPVVTERMNQLRAAPFEIRRQTYLDSRTRDQRDWYHTKAKANMASSTRWRIVLITAEVVSLVFAAAQVFGGWSLNLAGLGAALVASGAAWIAVKQFTTLASAYSTAASELSLQISKLESSEDDEWALAVADAEEAISREHTLWLASRTGKAPMG